ncbi:MAG TPA: methyltransferase domain-containing protein, partial [Acidimicrobiia bacterium]
RSTLVAGGAATVRQLDVDALADTLEQWHVAAASGFRDGRPPDRKLALPPAPLAVPPGSVERSPRATYVRTGAPAIAVYAVPGAGATPGALNVVARPEALPFRTAAFDMVRATALLERADDDHATERELARVVRPGGSAELEVPNREDALLRWQRFRDRCAGLRTPAHAYRHAPAHRREYTLAELAARLRGFTVTSAARPITWGDGPKRRAGTAVVRALRLRRAAQAFVIEAQRTAQHA